MSVYNPKKGRDPREVQDFNIIPDLLLPQRQYQQQQQQLQQDPAFTTPPRPPSSYNVRDIPCLTKLLSSWPTLDGRPRYPDVFFPLLNRLQELHAAPRYPIHLSGFAGWGRAFRPHNAQQDTQRLCALINQNIPKMQNGTEKILSDSLDFASIGHELQMPPHTREEIDANFDRLRRFLADNVKYVRITRAMHNNLGDVTFFFRRLDDNSRLMLATQFQRDSYDPHYRITLSKEWL